MSYKSYSVEEIERNIGPVYYDYEMPVVEYSNGRYFISSCGRVYPSFKSNMSVIEACDEYKVEIQKLKRTVSDGTTKPGLFASAKEKEDYKHNQEILEKLVDKPEGQWYSELMIFVTNCETTKYFIEERPIYIFDFRDELKEHETKVERIFELPKDGNLKLNLLKIKPTRENKGKGFSPSDLNYIILTNVRINDYEITGTGVGNGLRFFVTLEALNRERRRYVVNQYNRIKYWL